MRQQTSNGKTAKANGPVIVLELNELCPPILDRMMQKGELPNFSRLHAKSDVHVTWTDDQDLEPWVQWVTLHTGERQDVHGAKELDEGYRIKTPRIWEKLAERGLTSLIFGSMNAQPATENVYLVPDPWSKRVLPSDPAFMPFHNFVSFFVNEHTSKTAKPDRKTLARFARFMLGHGLSLGTIVTAVKQLVGEKLSGRDLKWRRALVLDLIMWDVFEHEYRRQKPMFATFFANSTAFLQHRYWRHMQPEVYSVKPSARAMASYGDAIEYSYRHMDQLVARAERMAGPSGRVVLATALSQEANLRYEDIGGKYVHRPHSFEKFGAWLNGPHGVTYEPVMTHQAWASCRNEEEAAALGASLAALEADGKPIIYWRRAGARVFFCCQVKSQVSDDLEIVNTKTGARIRFKEAFALVGQVNNSQHNRNGALWLERSDAAGKVHESKLPLEQSTALLLGMFAGQGIAEAPRGPQRTPVAQPAAAE